MSPDSLPWQAEADVLPTFFVGVSAPARVDREVAVDVLRGAVDLATSWIGLDVTWSTIVLIAEDNVRTPMNEDKSTRARLGLRLLAAGYRGSGSS